MRILLCCTAFALTAISGTGAACAQSATANSTHRDLPQFDAASIKPAQPDADRTLFRITPDGVSITNAPLFMILENALGVDEKHISGVPSWANTTRYDIEAKVAPEDAPRLNKLKGTDRNAMLAALLAERFSLKYHHETRELPVYALVVAKGGPKMTKGEPEDEPGSKPADSAADRPENRPKEHHKVMTTPGHIEADSVPMYILADQLTRLNALGRPVIDKTGLAGNYNFSLRWTADNLPFPMLHDSGGLDAATATDDNSPSSLITALEEQLGLKLVPQTDRSEIIVVDHIDPPSPN